ncbi:YdcF family protein [Roseobacter sp. AzwK-3b]|uniref:YdcF family protein n=1 Tax=Roseobacter sp. AzwK-3b TaxID=351016 RepID=UPI0018DD8E1F|nr:YdcF family protein [Roseobacter sp. AzwK-3b]
MAGVSVFAFWRRKIKLAVMTMLGLFLALSLMAVMPIGQALVARIEAQYAPPSSLDSLAGIVVLGGGENLPASSRWDTVVLGDGAERLTATLELARRFPDAKIVYAGGSGRVRDAFGAQLTEADIAQHFLLNMGLAPERLLTDPTSRNTAENAARAMELATPEVGQTWVLVTSAFHMPRAIRSFEAAGWSELVPYPVDYRTGTFTNGLGWDLTGNLAMLQIAIREAVGSFAYRLTNR